MNGAVIHTLWLLSVWLHILAATVWVGGMLYLVLVVVPWLRAEPRPEAAAFLRATGERFRYVGWSCFAVLLVTGTFNLWVRGVRLSDLFEPRWLRSAFGTTVVVKLCAFALVIGVSATHDFYVGPRAARAIEQDPRSPAAPSERRRASLLGRVNVVLALVLVAAAVMLVRGVPW